MTVTFYADSYEWERPSATVGYSRAVLDLERTAGGWKFTSFVPSDGLDLEAETVFTFDYSFDGFAKDEQGMDTWSDYKLSCWLLHADALGEGASTMLALRFLEDRQPLGTRRCCDGDPRHSYLRLAGARGAGRV